MFIGNSEIPIVSNIDSSASGEFDEIQPTNTKTILENHEAEMLSLTIEGFVNEELHSSSLSLEEQKDNIRSLKTNEVVENGFNYKDWKGHLLVETIDFTDTSDSRIVNEVKIDVKYFPWPQFYPGDEP